ncbi:MAG: DUF2062 domain-containing protein [Candidatus Methylumidiphilus sp.]
MSKKILLRFMPNREKIKAIKALEFLGDKLHRPNLWHFNRRSVSLAFAVGLWAMYTPPLPWQMAIAGTLAIYFNANLPIAVALVWITNPVTWIPMYYAAYKVGAWVLGQSSFQFEQFSQLFSIEKALELGAPLLLGCFILMNIGAVLGYTVTQFFWRRAVLRRWELRKYRNAPLDTPLMVRETHANFMRMLKHKETGGK